MRIFDMNKPDWTDPSAKLDLKIVSKGPISLANMNLRIGRGKSGTNGFKGSLKKFTIFSELIDSES